MATRRHRDVLACMLVTLGAVIAFGSVAARWFGYEPIVLLASVPVTVAIGSWASAMVLDDLDVREAAFAGGIAFSLALGVRQLDARETPALWMLGPCGLGATVSALVVYVAKRRERSQEWLPLAVGLLTVGTSVAVLVIVAILSPGSNWRIYGTLIAMVAAGGVAYALIPHVHSQQLVGGNALVLALVGLGFAVPSGLAAAFGSVLVSGVVGALIGGLGAALGFWAKPKAPSPQVAVARVVNDK